MKFVNALVVKLIDTKDLKYSFGGYIKNLVLSLLGLMDNHFTALWTHGHIKFFSIKTLKKLISNYKFDIKEISFSGRFYPLSSSMIFLLKRK